MRFRFSIIITAYVILFVTTVIMFYVLFKQENKYYPQSDIVIFAKQYLGVPYRYGGSSPTGFDCSGFILFLFHHFGQELPRTADQQATVGRQVNIDNLQPGNVVFFATTAEPTISHTGLYVGNHKFIHASSSAKKVIISDLDDPYWQSSLRGARQIIIKAPSHKNAFQLFIYNCIKSTLFFYSE